MSWRTPTPRGDGVFGAVDGHQELVSHSAFGQHFLAQKCATLTPKPTLNSPKQTKQPGPQKIALKMMFYFFGVGVSPHWSTIPDLDSPWPAEHFAQIFSSQGIPGREIQAKTISNCFSPFSGTSGPTSRQRHRIRNPRIALIILHRLSALGAF